MAGRVGWGGQRLGQNGWHLCLSLSTQSSFSTPKAREGRFLFLAGDFFRALGQKSARKRLLTSNNGRGAIQAG